MERKESFRNPKVKKRSVWGDIKTKFATSGFEVNEEILDRKWRNMKKTFSNIKDNMKTTGQGRVSWEYFDIFDEIYCGDKTINLPKTISSFNSVQQEVVPCTSTSLMSSGVEPEPIPSSLDTPSAKRSRMSTLHRQRRKQMDLEERRLEEIRLIRLAVEKNTQAVEKSNEIQIERNNLLKSLIEKL